MDIHCSTCDMPLEKKEDVGLIKGKESFCRYCVDKEGNVKSPELIFDGGVSFFMHAIPGTSVELAERLTRKNMKSLFYWRKKNEPCLQGLEATNAEYTEAMKQLGE